MLHGDRGHDLAQVDDLETLLDFLLEHTWTVETGFLWRSSSCKMAADHFGEGLIARAARQW